jgi:glycine/D-amino acid oxidase-like deaminating enzyme
MDVKKRLTCDVLVVGGGNAGLVTAIEAKNSGAGVLLIDKAPRKARGGNSRLSGGLFRIAADGNKDYLPLLEGTQLPKGQIDMAPYSKDDSITRCFDYPRDAPIRD